MSSKVSIVILNFNGEKHLNTYLPSVIKYSPNAHIVIIDNCSTDDSVEYIRSKHPQIQLIILDSNYGFAEGYNKGLKSVESKYYVLLNNDVRVTQNWLDPLITSIEKENLAGCQPKILSDINQNYFEHAGACGGFIDKDFFPFCRGRIFDTIEKDTKQYEESLDVFWCSGAALAIKSEIFHEMNGFDELFFAHMEEIDLCWRIQNHGHRFKVIPQSTVFHLGGGTLNYESSSKVYLNFRNNLFMIFKNYNGWIFTKLIRRMTIDSIAALQFLLKGKFNFFFSVFLAHMNFYANIPKLIKRRKKLKKKKSKKLIGFYKKSILISFFINKNKKFSDLKF